MCVCAHEYAWLCLHYRVLIMLCTLNLLHYLLPRTLTPAPVPPYPFTLALTLPHTQAHSLSRTPMPTHTRPCARTPSHAFVPMPPHPQSHPLCLPPPPALPPPPQLVHSSCMKVCALPP